MEFYLKANRAYWESRPTQAFRPFKLESTNPHRAQMIGDRVGRNSYCLVITFLLYTSLVYVGHIPTGFLVIEVQYIMYQIHLRF